MDKGFDAAFCELFGIPHNEFSTGFLPASLYNAPKRFFRRLHECRNLQVFYSECIDRRSRFLKYFCPFLIQNPGGICGYYVMHFSMLNVYNIDIYQIPAEDPVR